MQSVWEKTFFRSGMGILNYLLKLEVGRTLTKGKYPIICQSGESCTLPAGEKRGEGTPPFPFPETTESLPSSPVPVLSAERTRTALGQKEVLLPSLQPQGPGNHLRARERWRLSVSLWFCGSRMFFLVWINLLKQPSITYLSTTLKPSAKGFLSWCRLRCKVPHR